MYHLNMVEVKTRFPAAFLGLFVLILFGCASGPAAPSEMPVEAPETEESAPADVLPEDSVPEEENELPEPDEEDSVPEDEEVMEDEEIYLETEEFVISTEMYETTFNEVEAVIQELNQIIADRDFARWQSFLTDDFRELHSDPEVLRERSESPVLRRNNIELRSLEDYFTWVVVPSRANARLDDLDFIGTDQVEAIMRIRDQGVILYQLKRVDDHWKIDVY